jgi:O-glycosyl hydrolase
LSQSVAASITVVSFLGSDTSGANGSGAIGATASANARSGVPAATLITTRNDSWVFGVGNDWDMALARTVGANQTMVHQYLASVGDTYWVQRQNAPTPFSGTGVSINDTAPTTGRYNLSIVEILPAPASGIAYSISGTITPPANGAGASVTLTGAATANTTADTNGYYSFTGLANGSYTVTPGKSGFSFTPALWNVTISGSSQTANFTAAPQTWTISGALTPSVYGAGTTVTLTGAATANTTADTNGYYSFAGLANGSYTVTPSKDGCTFSPASRNVTINGANQTANFTAAAQTWTISGAIAPSAGGSGATVTLARDGTTITTTTADGSGSYLFSGLVNGTYTVTPSKAGFLFTPASQNVTINGAAVTGVNFSVSPQPGVISGTISPASNGAGATLTLSGAASATTTADSSGNYGFSGLADGTYTITPSKPSVVFNPTSQNVTLNGAGVVGVNFSATAFTPNLTVDGSLMYQTIDGMGANIDVGSWKGGQVAPALDLLIDTNGASLFRVVRDPMTWVNNESQIPLLHALDPATLQQAYETPAMQDIWNTIAYLNQKGITGNQIMLNFMGWTPTWLGGSGRYGVASYITSGKESEFATMLASLMYYGRKVKNLDFTLLSPLNETDLGGIEGPHVSTGQYATILRGLIAEMNYMGVGDVRLVGPDTAGSGGGYISAMMADTTIRGSVDHLASHVYGASTSPGASYPPRNYWLTETAASCSRCDSGVAPSQGEWAFASQTGDYALGDLNRGWSAVVIWDGFDSFFYHENAYNCWGLLAYDPTTGAYTPRKRFYVNAQINHFVRPGAVRISVTDSISGLGNVVAFYQLAAEQVSIVGHNSGGSTITINGQLKNLPVTVASLAIYLTNATTNLQRGPDVPVSTGGAFAVTIPADTFFSLSN